ncbi:hypothetical protein GGF31_007207 [Allomyces arbusculus]|nr:hypothetical protein GGF31_007207 [Allomyces arbusculus]
MREAIDPHWRYLMWLISPVTPQIMETRAARALTDRPRSLQRYLGVVTPHTTPYVSGTDPCELATAAQMLRDTGYVTTAHGISWNGVWPQYARRKNCGDDDCITPRLADPAWVRDVVAALRGGNHHDPITLVYPLVVVMNDPDKFVRPLSAVPGRPPRLVLDARGLDPADAWEIKQRWPNLEVDVDLSAFSRVTPNDVHRHATEGHVDGVVLGRSVVADPVGLLDVIRDAPCRANDVNRDQLVLEYAYYADVAQHMFGHPYAATELLMPLFPVFQHREGTAFRRLLLDELNRARHAIAAPGITHPSSPYYAVDRGAPTDEYTPGPVFRIIEAALERLQRLRRREARGGF